MARQWLVVACLSLSLSGCGQSEVVQAPPPDRALKTPSDPLLSTDIEQFLRIVQALPNGRMPEFSADSDAAADDQNLPGRTLVENFRSRFRRICDPRRQGALWSRDPEWAQVLLDHQTTPAEFAATMRNIGCAVMRMRMQGRFDVERLVREAQAQVDRLVRQMDEVDGTPATQMTGELAFVRTQAALRLRQAVALLEFAEMVKPVPAESIANVGRFEKQLTPLLGASDKTELFTELQKWSDRNGEVQPAGFEVSE